MRSNILGRSAFLAASAVLVCSVAFAQSTASFAQTEATSRGSMLKPQLVTSFECDSTHCFFAESITADRDGNLYVSLSDWVSTCEILRVTPDGKQTKVVAAFPLDICSNGFLLGVAFDEENRLHVAAYTWAGPTNPGVYRVNHDGTPTLVLSLPADSFPNGLAFYRGDMYVSDSYLGAIWKKRPHDGIVATVPWYLNIPILAPTGWGANGLAFYQDALYIGVIDAGPDAAGKETGSIVRLPILPDGSPGVYEFAAPPDPRLYDVDGFAFDVTGKLWFPTVTGSDGLGGKLGTLDEDGKLRILTDSPGWLDYTSMLVFGTTFGTRGTLYLTNGGLNAGHPNVLSINVGVAGMPLPAR